MRETGIVRRIDDLGRVVIPKEIRQNFRIREGDPLELFIDGDLICFKKYNTMLPLEETLQSVRDMLKDEDVSRKISVEDKTVVEAMVNMLLKKWKEEGDNNEN